MRGYDGCRQWLPASTALPPAWRRQSSRTAAWSASRRPVCRRDPQMDDNRSSTSCLTAPVARPVRYPFVTVACYCLGYTTACLSLLHSNTATYYTGFWQAHFVGKGNSPKLRNSPFPEVFGQQPAASKTNMTVHSSDSTEHGSRLSIIGFAVIRVGQNSYYGSTSSL